MIGTPFPPEREPRALPAGDHALDGARPEHVLYSYGYPAEETSHFWDYWRVIRRRRWTIITAFLVLVTAVTVTSFSARPVYRASATLRIEKDQPRIVKFEEVLKEDSQQDYYQTQYRILQSRSLANRVIGLLQFVRTFILGACRRCFALGRQDVGQQRVNIGLFVIQLNGLP